MQKLSARNRDRISDLPRRRYLRQSEVHAYLGRMVAEDAARAGMLPVLCKKPAPKGGANSAVFYARADVLAVEHAMMAGRYPGTNS